MDKKKNLIGIAPTIAMILFTGLLGLNAESEIFDLFSAMFSLDSGDEELLVGTWKEYDGLYSLRFNSNKTGEDSEGNGGAFGYSATSKIIRFESDLDGSSYEGLQMKEKSIAVVDGDRLYLDASIARESDIDDIEFHIYTYSERQWSENGSNFHSLSVWQKDLFTNGSMQEFVYEYENDNGETSEKQSTNHYEWYITDDEEVYIPFNEDGETYTNVYRIIPTDDSLGIWMQTATSRGSGYTNMENYFVRQ